MRNFRSVFLYFFILAFVANVQGQSINGTVREMTTEKRLPNISVQIFNLRDSSRQETITDSLGTFNLNSGKGIFRVVVKQEGFSSFVTMVRTFGGDANLGFIELIDSSKTTGTAVIKAQVAPVNQNGDTTEYNAAAYKTNPDATAGDLVKKMPGITVENGKIMAQGEEVKKVTVDGKEYFGDDANAALNNIPAEVIDRIQVFQRMSDQAQFTGFDDGNSMKALNIRTKQGKANGTFGKVYAGYGTDERYQSGLVYNKFNGGRRITVLGMANNVNIQNFSSQDLIGLSGGSGGAGGMGRGPGGYRRASTSDNFFTNSLSGITATQALGFNYNDKWGKKATIGASYFLNSNQSAQIQNLQRTFNNSFNTQGSQLYLENSNTNNKPLNHRLNVRLEYKFDTSTSLLYTPTFSWQKSQYDQALEANNFIDTQRIGLNRSNFISEGTGWNLKNELLFRHKFHKDGRTFTWNIDHSLNRRNTESKNIILNQSFFPLDSVYSTQQLINSFAPTESLNSRVTWTEPLSKITQIQIDYRSGIGWNDNRQETLLENTVSGEFSRLDTVLSNSYTTQSTSHEPGVMFRYRSENFWIGAGTGYQIATLRGEQLFPNSAGVNKDFRTWMPRVFMNLKIDKNTNVRGMFRTSVNLPTVNQLQNVFNTSNALILSTGNTELKQEVTRNLNISLNKSNPKKLTSLFFGITGGQNSNYIVSTTSFLSKDTQLSESFTAVRGTLINKPENLAGYWTGKLMGNYGFPIRAIKTNANINTFAGLTQLPGRINGLLNMATTQNLSGGLVLSSNISENVDFTLSYFANYFNTQNTTQSSLDNIYYSHVANARINYIIKKKLVLQSDVTYNAFEGLSSNFNQNFILWNAGVAYKFLKNNAGELKFSCFDLLKQNRSLARTINASFIEDNFTQVLTRYFMLTFTYNFRHFANGGKEPEPEVDPHKPISPPGVPGTTPTGRPPY